MKHIVYHSVFRVERFKDVPHFASKLAIESALREFDVPFTVIRPNYFIQNDATLKDAITKFGIYPDGHYGKTYNLNGPDALSGLQAAAIWNELLARETALSWA